jgi:hypothetical protein
LADKRVERAQILWQFKDTVLTRPDLDQFIGATLSRWDSGTTLRLVCRSATRDAKKKAAEVTARGPVTLIIEEEG